MQYTLSRRALLATGGSLVSLSANPVATWGQQQDSSDASFLHGVGKAESQAIRAQVDGFMKRYQVPGLSLAMAKDGALKLVAGFGRADVERRKPVRSDSRFRIASVSKPITGVTVAKLVEQKKLSLQDKVFATGGALRRYYAAAARTGAENKRRLELITLEHLLQHTCGGWGNSRDDPMFAKAALTYDHDRLIRWTLANQVLKHDPGRRFSYSNFGYCLLGRVIERATGKPYDKAVQDLVLGPAGVNGMQLGRRRKEERLEDEVVYYGQKEDPYGQAMQVKRMDAHGGWIATATDLVRFAIRVDGIPSPPDVLSDAALKRMATPSSANPNYAGGWAVNRANNWWHLGGFNGGAALIARINDGHCWAVVLNTRGRQSEFNRDLDGLPWKIRRSVRHWEDHDLLSERQVKKRRAE